MFAGPLRPWLPAAALAAALVCPAAPAGAGTSGPPPVNVFHSPNDDGVDLRPLFPPGCGGEGGCVIQGGPGEVLWLWIDGGPSASFAGEEVICKQGQDGGSGDELCGGDALVQIEGPGFFTDFFPDEGLQGILIHHPPCNPESEGCDLPAGTKQIRLVFRRGTSDPPVGPRRIGTLILDSTGASATAPTQVLVTGVAAAGAKLQQRLIPAGVIALPEPGQVVMLAAGLGAVSALLRRRRRSSPVR